MSSIMEETWITRRGLRSIDFTWKIRNFRYNLSDTSGNIDWNLSLKYCQSRARGKQKVENVRS